MKAHNSALTRLTALFLFAVFCANPVLAGGSGDGSSFSNERYNRAVEKQLGHKLDANETAIANATYNWYSQKYEKDGWDSEKIDFAVDKGVKNCQSDTMLAAAKAGEFGEKLLKALVVSAGEAADAVGKWVDEKSKKFDEDK